MSPLIANNMFVFSVLFFSTDWGIGIWCAGVGLWRLTLEHSNTNFVTMDGQDRLNGLRREFTMIARTRDIRFIASDVFRPFVDTTNLSPKERLLELSINVIQEQLFST